MMSTLENVLITRVENAAAAGTTTLTSDTVDMAGYESCTFIALLGTITATGIPGLSVQQSADDSSYAALAGTAVVGDDGDGNLMLICEVVRPRDRYLQAVLTRTTANVVCDGIIALQSKPNLAPVTQGATVVSAETHHSPAEGAI